MKYYKIDFKGIFREEDKVLGHANGQFVPNYELYFDRIRKDEIVEDAPIFDYFHLQSFGEEKDWEWRLQDVHGGIGEYPGGTNWYISDNFKILLEDFKIAPKYHFYETRLLYKGKKLKYWIFQFPLDPNKNIDFQKSTFYLHDDIKEYNFLSEEEFVIFYRKFYRECKKKLKANKLVLKSYFDILYSTNNEIIVSEALKQSIEKNGIIGFEFFEIDYEVVVG